MDKFLKEGLELDKLIETYLNYDFDLLFEKTVNKREKRPSIAGDIIHLAKGAGKIAGKIGRGIIDKISGRKSKIKTLLKDAKKNKLPKSRIMQLQDELKKLSNQEIAAKSKLIKNKNKSDKRNRKIAKLRKKEMKKKMIKANLNIPMADDVIEEGIGKLAMKLGIWTSSLMPNLVGMPLNFSKNLFSNIFKNFNDETIDKLHHTWVDINTKRKALTYLISQLKDPKTIELVQSILNAYNNKEKDLEILKNNKSEKLLQSIFKGLDDLEDKFKSLKIPNYMM